MSFDQALPYLVVLVSSVTVLSYLSQARLIVKNHSSKNVSRFEYIWLMFGNALWFLYGWQIHSLPLLVTSGMLAVGATSVLWAEYRYKSRRRADSGR